MEMDMYINQKISLVVVIIVPSRHYLQKTRWNIVYTPWYVYRFRSPTIFSSHSSVTSGWNNPNLPFMAESSSRALPLKLQSDKYNQKYRNMIDYQQNIMTERLNGEKIIIATQNSWQTHPQHQKHTFKMKFATSNGHHITTFRVMISSELNNHRLNEILFIFR